MTAALGTRFVDALATRDRDGLEAVLHPDVDFRGLTPNRVWEAAGAGTALARGGALAISQPRPGPHVRQADDDEHADEDEDNLHDPAA